LPQEKTSSRVAVVMSAGQTPVVIVDGEAVSVLIIDMGTVPAGPVTHEGLSDLLTWTTVHPNQAAMHELFDVIVAIYKKAGLTF